MKLRTVVVFGLLLVATAATADAPKPSEVTLTITPAAEPNPTFKYRLWPDPSQRTPGNAAVLYMRVFSPDWTAARKRWPQGERLTALLNRPLSELKSPVKDEPAGPDSPISEVEWIANPPSLKDLELAARKRTVDWELWEQIRDHGIDLLLPELQGYRQLAQYLALSARVKMATGDFAGAARSLESGLSLGHDLAENPTLVHALVGVAVALQALGQLETWVQIPGSPNLYWAPTNLPSPLVDLRQAFGGERQMISGMFPGIEERLKDISLPPLGVNECREIYRRLSKALSESAQTEVLEVAAYTASRETAANQMLKDRGWTDEQIKARPAIQRALMFDLAEYERMLDEMTRIIGLPYPERMAQALKLKNDKSGQLAQLLAPAAKVHAAPLKLEKRIAAMRVVEAIRAHAAKTNALPTRLSDITIVPVPNDPGTGRSFEYSLEGATAKLWEKDPLNIGNTIEFKITLAK